MIDFAPTRQMMHEQGLSAWAEHLEAQLEKAFFSRLHGDFPHWMEAVEQLPEVPASQVILDQDMITVTSEPALPANAQERIGRLLQQLHPWRKGPFTVHGVHIDTEWRSDWKWRRLQQEIAPLRDRRVLDVGCGNGYHCWRMAGAGASVVIGIDPTQLYLAQFLALRHFLGDHWPVHLLPLGIEAIPHNLQAFDSVFSMGILYHRRSPMDHLLELKGALRPGGELILETLVIEGKAGETLVPEGRYAKMRNVWFIPSAATLSGWLQRCGFSNVRILDVTPTRIEEQRSTPWMRFESLPDFLDPGDPTRTIEGHPAPRRAILLANR